MQTLSFQAPDDISKRLAAFAKKLDRSKGYLIRAALEEYLEELQDYVSAAQYKASYDPEENVSFAEIKRRHKLD